jgi:hypothetical protein
VQNHLQYRDVAGMPVKRLLKKRSENSLEQLPPTPLGSELAGQSKILRQYTWKIPV